MNQSIFLEVNRDNGAIMAYTHYKRESANFDFYEVTAEELQYLNNLEDYVLPEGYVASISDLFTYREYQQKAQIKAEQESKKAAAKAIAKTAAATDTLKALQEPQEKCSKASTTKAGPGSKGASKREPMTKTEFFKGFTNKHTKRNK